MKKTFLNTDGIIKKRARFFIVVLFNFVFLTTGFAQRSQAFIYDCVSPGKNMIIDAVITGTDASTFYHWQYKTPAGDWTCFINGVNTINGSSFTVSGATGAGFNNAPALTILGVGPALENVIVRVTMARGVDPCSTPVPGEIWGADDEAPNDTKYLRLHIYANSTSCPPNSFLCPANLLVNNGMFFGGFENTSFDVISETYSRNNFGGANASSDLSFGTGKGHYQDINNPFAMNSAFARNIAPHSGDNQLVIEGSSQITDRVWHKTVPVKAGKQYAFTAWAARVDNTDPIIELYADNSLLVSNELSLQPVGSWDKLQGTFVAPASGNINFSIRDGRPGGENNFTIDDLCLRECSNCSTLELHQLNLSASLQKFDAKLKWIAENEMGTTNFMIERSFDGITYDRIASKSPQGPVNTPTSYYYTDDIEHIGAFNTIYYRIKALDTDGRFAYSNVVVIRLLKSTGIQAWPVPFVESVNISYTAVSNSRVEISLTNTLGKIVKRLSCNVSRGLNQLALNDLQSVLSGIYFVRITDVNTNEVSVLKISK